MSKKLSIIVPVYNMATEGKLNYCLDSLVGQTIRGLYDYEILCVDDASTDDSLEILLDYQKRYPELVCVIPNPVNLRQGGAKNAGLRVAQGEWIGFIDSDDWVSPDYYEKLLKKAEATGADLVGCDYSLVDHHTFEVGKVIVNNTPDQTGDLTKEKHERLFMRPGSMVLKIYKHSVIRENHLDFPEHIFYEDNCAGPLWSFLGVHCILAFCHYAHPSAHQIHRQGIHMLQCHSLFCLMQKQVYKSIYHNVGHPVCHVIIDPRSSGGIRHHIA